ncbi:MAG TPA: hypothetical protein ENI80_11695 [Acidiferrobacteraceae bacterium]|nr:hypothetical protein [Acidiferrobacteraceae bacterium]
MEILDRLNEWWPGWVNDSTLWRAAAAFFVVMLVMIIRRLVTRSIIGRLHRIASRTRFRYDEKMIDAITPSISGLFLVLGVYLAVQLLPLPTAPVDTAGIAEQCLVSGGSDTGDLCHPSSGCGGGGNSR